MKAMAFANTVFIVPSAEVHSHATPRLEGDRLTFNFAASPANRLIGVIAGGLMMVQLAAYSSAASTLSAVSATGPLPPALQLWAGFPVHASPRPIVLAGFGNDEPHGVYGNAETKLALACGDFNPPTGLPRGPASAAGYRLISASSAFASLQPHDHTGSCARPHTPLTLTEAHLGQASFGTDRGPRTFPAWRFSFEEVEGPIPVLAIAPEAEWFPPGLAAGASHDIGARVGRDHLTLTFTFVGAQSEEGPCGERYEVQLTESPTAVMVTLIVHRNTSDSKVACTLIGFVRHASASLTAPLGARVLVNDLGYPIAALVDNR
jgi:hypothetical protein